MKKAFSQLFKHYRLKAGFATLSTFGNELAKKGYIYEDSIFSHWQKGTKRPPHRNIIIALIQIFVEKESISFIAQANEFLDSCGYGYLTDFETSLIFLKGTFISEKVLLSKDEILSEFIDKLSYRELSKSNLAEILALFAQFLVANKQFLSTLSGEKPLSFLSKEKQKRNYIEELIIKTYSLQYISTLLGHSYNKRHIAEIFAYEGSRALGADYGEITLINEDQLHFTILAHTPFPKGYILPEMDRKNKMIMNDSIDAKELILVANISALNNEYQLARSFMCNNISQSCATFPLKLPHYVFGIMQFFFNTKNSFDSLDQIFLKSLASKCTQSLLKIL